MTSLLQRVFAVAVLALSTAAILPLLLGDVDATGISDPEGNRSIQLIWSLIYLGTALQLLPQWRKALALLGRDKLLVSLLALAFASVLWSVAPAVTFRRSVAILGTTLIGVHLVLRFNLREIARLLAAALAALAVLSVIFAIVMPDLGIMQGKHDGAWRGVFVHKNSLGEYMALGMVIYALLVRERRNWYAFAGIGFCGALLLLSTSKTALVTMIYAVAVVILAGSLRRNVRLLGAITALGLTVLTVVVVWIVANYATILNSLGRDATLTGRTLLWQAVLMSIGQRPWLGYGFGAYWTGAHSAYQVLFQMVLWDAPHAHNGYLDALLNLGVIGGALFGISLIRVAARTVSTVRADVNPIAMWPLVFVALMLVHNLAETSIMRTNSLFWILYVVVSVGTLEKAKQANAAAGGVLSNDGALPSGRLGTARPQPGPLAHAVNPMNTRIMHEV